MFSLVALLLASTPAGPLKVASTSFTSVGGLAPDLAQFYGETFAARLGEQPGFQVTTPSAITAMVGLDRQKQLLGCAEAANACVAELASALGVDAIVIGEAAKLDQSTQVNVRVIKASDGSTLFSLFRRAKTSEEVLDALGSAAADAAAKLRERFGITQPPPPAGGAAPRLRWVPWAVVGAGAVSAGVGTFFLVQASDAWTRLTSEPVASFPVSAANTTAATGKRDLTLGLVLVGVGGAALVAGLVWALLGEDSPAPTAWLCPEGGAVGVAGRLP